ncbi:MAG: hypothetical protein ACYTGP_05195 [Planctomycetota bacterium]|jgi:hypothetical protein
MNPTRTIVITVAALLIAGASLLASGPTPVEPAPRDPASSPLAATFDAHGGLDRFRSYRQLAYTMDGFPLSPQMAKRNRSTVDLHRRFNRIDGDGFTVGFDGTDAWSEPVADASGLPSRFVTLGSFYFIGMPFVFGDEGVVVTPAGTQTFRGRSYRVFQIGYVRGTGYTSKDDYTVLIDPATDRLALIHHSVTENPDVDRVTWVFDRWQTVDGLLVPAQLTFHPGWNPDDPGEGHSFTVEDVHLSAVAPDASLYARPKGATVDARPAVHE